ncbi:hypothetical protein SDC9_66282 [bioreactor metagenome]|uniref:Uncharacterized protein n=1 Tax=bioreactor metagenome TaxID=1076179 RepID=A0A644XUL3_9ZZZZ
MTAELIEQKTPRGVWSAARCCSLYGEKRLFLHREFGVHRVVARADEHADLGKPDQQRGADNQRANRKQGAFERSNHDQHGPDFGSQAIEEETDVIDVGSREDHAGIAGNEDCDRLQSEVALLQPTVAEEEAEYAAENTGAKEHKRKEPRLTANGMREPKYDKCQTNAESGQRSPLFLFAEKTGNESRNDGSNERRNADDRGGRCNQLANEPADSGAQRTRDRSEEYARKGNQRGADGERTAGSKNRNAGNQSRCCKDGRVHGDNRRMELTKRFFALSHLITSQFDFDLS